MTGTMYGGEAVNEVGSVSEDLWNRPRFEVVKDVVEEEGFPLARFFGER